MSLPGKILAILNLLGAFALTYLAALDYGKRVTWEQAVVRSDLIIKGLPLSREEVNKQGTRPVVESVTPQMRRELFQNAGEPVATQVEEVERVRKAVEDTIQQAGAPQAQVVQYARLLLPFAVSNMQRETLLGLEHYLKDAKSVEALKKQLSDAVAAADAEAKRPDSKVEFPKALALQLDLMPGEPARPFAENLVKALAADRNRTVNQVVEETITSEHARLKAQLDGLFAEAADTKKDGKDRPREEHRAAVAHVLFNLVESTPPGGGGALPDDILALEGYKRVFAVVGLEAAIREMNTQARVLGEIQSELSQELARDRSNFAVAHTHLVGQSQELAERVDRAKAQVQRTQQQVANQETLVARRMEDVKTAEQDLAAARRVTDTRLKELLRMRGSLFDTRLELRELSAENQKRVQKIAELERQENK